MKKVLICILGILASQSAFALFEARLTYGVLGGKPDLTQVYSGPTAIPAIAANSGIGFDAIAVLPLVGLGGGLRYENLGFSISNSGLEFKSQITRTSLVLNYRIINTLLYLGPIATLGINHASSLKWTDSNSNTRAEFTPDTASSYTVGLEAGVGLAGFIIGAEAGYQNLKWNQLKDSTGGFSNTPDLDMSGSYMKVILGFGI